MIKMTDSAEAPQAAAFCCDKGLQTSSRKGPAFLDDLQCWRGHRWCLHVRLQATGKNFVMDDKFNLGDLLRLELHNYVDACSEIVDRAQKELVIEKSLRKIEDTWGALNLTFSPYQVGCYTLILTR